MRYSSTQRILSAIMALCCCTAIAGQDIDAAIDMLMQADPAALAVRVKALESEATAQAAQAVELREKADALEAQAVALGAQIDGFMAHVKALGARFMPPPPPPAMATEAAANLTTYQDHVLPILKQHCAQCHNPDKRKSGLSVVTFANLMEGGSSGVVVAAGEPDGSRLLRLITKQEEPFMPPSGEISAPEIEIIRKWIADGALANAQSKPTMVASVEEEKAPGEAFVAAQFADTPPMPVMPLVAAQAVEQRGVVARAVDTNPRSPLMAVGANRQILLYNIETAQLLGALPFPEGDIFTLTFSVSGEVLLAAGGQEGNSGIAALYNVRTCERIGTYGEYYDTVLAADISPDHRLIALGGPNKKVRVYSVETGEELYTLDKHTEWIYCVKFTPDGEVLATADRGGGLWLWQAANGREVEQLRGHTGAIHALAYTADSKYLASAGADGTVQIWDTWKYTRVRSFKAHNQPVLYVDIAADNRIVTTGVDRTTKIFDFEGKEQKSLPGLSDWGYTACFADEDKTVLAGSWTGDVILWNAESGEKVAEVETMPNLQS